MYKTMDFFDSYMLGILIVIAIGYLIAWCMTMATVCDIAEDKGYKMAGLLWFIGLFGFIFTPCIIVAALPDKTLLSSQAEIATIIKGLRNETPSASIENKIDDELPSI